MYPYLRVDACPIFRQRMKLFLELVESPVYGETSPLIRHLATALLHSYEQFAAVSYQNTGQASFFELTILEFKFGSNGCHVERCDSSSSVDDNPRWMISVNVKHSQQLHKIAPRWFA